MNTDNASFIMPSRKIFGNLFVQSIASNGDSIIKRGRPFYFSSEESSLAPVPHPLRDKLLRDGGGVRNAWRSLARQVDAEVLGRSPSV